ncbi:MAG: LytTR family transcriptional regulator DNA-binding domain-containing protein [Monoglobus pectinilyticus]
MRKFPFIRCHNSFYVNMDYVKEFSRYVISTQRRCCYTNK